MSSKCFTTGQNCCQPFVFLRSRMFTYGLRVSPSDRHATIPLFHWLSSCFLVVYVFYQCDIRILVLSHEIRKLFLLDYNVNSVLWACEILVRTDENLVKTSVNLVKFLCDSCENQGYVRGLLWGNTARQCPQEIPFGIPKSTTGGVSNPCATTVPDITSDNHTLSEQITCSILKTQVSICTYPMDYIAITYV